MGVDKSQKLLGQHFSLMRMNTFRDLNKSNMNEISMTQKAIAEESEGDSFKESNLSSIDEDCDLNCHDGLCRSKINSKLN